MSAAFFSRRRCLQAAALGALPWGGQRARAQSPQVLLRLSHVVAEQTPKGLALQYFAQQVQALSQGRIAVQVYPNSLLFGDEDEMQALQLGAVDILAPSLSKFGRIGFPEFELFDLPFLFDTRADVHRVMQGEVGQALLAVLSRQRLVGLGYLDNGFKHMSANRPLRAPSDFAGLRMRVQSSRVIGQQMRALGAQPVVLTFGETYRALASGVVDGTENPVSNFWTQRMHEVQSHFTLTRHGYLGYGIVVHQRLWQHLVRTDRRLVYQALVRALQWGNTIAQQKNDAALRALRASGSTQVHEISDAERALLRHKTQEAYRALQGRIGAQWLQRVGVALS